MTSFLLSAQILIGLTILLLVGVHLRAQFTKKCCVTGDTPTFSNNHMHPFYPTLITETQSN
ncbi:hypothetical protein [Pseudovibrio sp. Ad37]|uniref:hypothetical protein n=1 Tax=Pseudovibrio sp. Ad37 TaxID=989422 RepID=UPI0007AE9B8E|nr:hypothetical protein [Pseudovibrio sp. Ad37]KZL22673.1 hypothetical protein PsAD37_03321 [Pseudovibrio sp. Ad37]